MKTAILHRPDVAGEARDWFVRLLDDDVRAEDIADWETWLRADPEHGRAYDRLTEIWAVAGEAAMAPAASQTSLSDRYDGSVSVSAWRRRLGGRPRLVWAASVATIVLAVLAGGAVWRLTAAKPEIREFQTARGQNNQAVLADGSRIDLGGMTTLRVTYRSDRRSVELKSGEALFKVAHQASRPFVVQTAFGDITAVGTAFDVDVGATRTDLWVTQGVVSVDPAAFRDSPGHVPNRIRVSAGERLVLDSEGARLIRAQAGDSAPPWLQGRFEYRDSALASVLEDVNRYAARPIVLGDAALGRMAYTGTVRLDDIDTWVVALQRAFSLSAEHTPDGKIVLRQKIIRSRLPLSAAQAS